MKTINKLVLLTLLLISVQTMFAQEEHSLGQAPGFVKSERLLPHYQGGNSLANTGYGIYLSSPNKFVSIPIPTGTPISYVNNDFSTKPVVAADIDDSGNYFCCTQFTQGTSHLIQVDLSTGIPTVIATITGFNYHATSLAYNYTNSTWYFGSSNNSVSRLYSLDIVTGSLSLIGQITGLAGLASIAIDCDGNAYGFDIVTDQLFSINLSTGAGTAIGPLGFNANFAQDADFDAATDTLYLAAYNYDTFQGEFRSVDVTTGNSTLITSWQGPRIYGFAIDNTCGPSCPVGAPSNPNPQNGECNLPVTGNTLVWMNGSGTINVEVWFGKQGNVVKVYDGPAITSFDLPPLIYNTNYLWFIKGKDANCVKKGPIWTFNTMQASNLFQYCELFHSLCNWNIIGPFGLTNWSISGSDFAGGNPTELRMIWTPFFNGESKIRSNSFPIVNNYFYQFSFNFYFDWYADPSGTVNVGITYDGGVTSTTLYSITNPTGNVGPTIISGNFLSPSTGASNAQLEISFLGNSFNIDNIYWDNICISGPIPVELISFTADVNDNAVTLLWQTATETNNSGFEVERSQMSKVKSQTEWQRIGFVEGKGTTTEIQSYSFTDKPEPGMYKYRLKQIDFNGTFAYSSEVEAEVRAPNVFSLEQNYPNPFNPTTKIKYTIPETGNPLLGGARGGLVTLKVFDILGNEVATLVNEEQAPGQYEIEFSVAQVSRPEITSGIYFYQLKAGSFIETKKMILLK